MNANGSATTYTIEWGTTTRYGSQTAAASAGNGRTPTAVTARLTGLQPVHALSLAHGGHQRGRHHARARPHVPDRAAALRGHHRALAPHRAVGRRPADRRAGDRRRRRRDDRRAPAAAVPDRRRTSRSSRPPARAATAATCSRSRPCGRPRAIASSRRPRPSPPARSPPPSSAVKVGAGARHRTRTWARVEGYVLPAVHGTASLQRYRSRTGWRQVKFKTVAPADAVRTRYSFSVGGRGSRRTSCA